MQQMNNPINDASTLVGTVSGTLLVVMMHLTTGEILKTTILAAIGAAVSFGVSYALKRLLRKKEK